MGFTSAFKNFMSAKDFDEEDYTMEYEFEDEYEEPAPRVAEKQPTPVQISKTENEKILSINPKKDFDIRAFAPTSTAELANITQCFKNGIVCIINIQALSNEEAQTTADFVGGAAFALNGTIKSLSEEIIIATPSNIGFKGDVYEEVVKYTNNTGFFR